jgi:hypothetical protein
MLKKSLFIGFAVLAGAALVFTACEKEVTKEVPGSGWMMLVQTWGDTQQALSEALLNPDSGVIGTKAAITLDAALTIPAGKTLVTFADINGAAITVEGKVYVGNGSALTATATNLITVKGSGSIAVEKGGVLTTNAASSVKNESGATALGSGVAVVGGTLKFSEATDVADVAKIGAALSYISSGTLAITSSTLAPSALTAITIPADKKLTVEGTGAETSDTLSIPAWLDLTTTANLGTVKTLSVSGKLTATAGTGHADGIALTVGEKSRLTLGTVAKLKGSTVAASGVLNIVAVTAYDANAKVAVSAGGTVNSIKFPGNTNITGGLATATATIDSLTIPASETGYLELPAGKTLTVMGVLTVNGGLVLKAADSKVLLSAGAQATVAAGGKLYGINANKPNVTKVTLTVVATSAPTTATKAKITDSGSVYTLTTEASTGIILTKTVGNASFAFTDAAINALEATAAATAANGTFKAGAGTAIILAGK